MELTLKAGEARIETEYKGMGSEGLLKRWKCRRGGVPAQYTACPEFMSLETKFLQIPTP